MREIKFKARRLDNGEWICGDLVQDKVSNHTFIASQTAGIPWSDEWMEFCYIVDPATVCEFTGLKDKNGVDIFEGDILNVHRYDSFKEYVSEVKFNKGCFYTYCPHKSIAGNETLWAFYDGYEVIGNVHDKEGEEG